MTSLTYMDMILGKKGELTKSNYILTINLTAYSQTGLFCPFENRLKFWTNSIPYANEGIVPYTSIHVLLAVCSIRKAPLRSHLHFRLMDLAEEPCSTKGYKVILR